MEVVVMNNYKIVYATLRSIAFCGRDVQGMCCEHVCAEVAGNHF